MKYFLLLLSFAFASSSLAGESCTNFEGHWQGYCHSDNGHSEFVRWSITQEDCEGFSVNRLDFIFSKETRYHASDLRWNYTYRDRFSFDKDQESLNLRRILVANNRVNYDRIHGDGWGQLEKIDEDRLRFVVDMRYASDRPRRIWYDYTSCNLRPRN